MSNFSAVSWLYLIRWDDNDEHFVVDQTCLVGFYSASSLKQQSAGKHVASLRHIIKFSVKSGEKPLKQYFSEQLTF
jgi:hypothetical protein